MIPGWPSWQSNVKERYSSKNWLHTIRKVNFFVQKVDKILIWDIFAFILEYFKQKSFKLLDFNAINLNFETKLKKANFDPILIFFPLKTSKSLNWVQNFKIFCQIELKKFKIFLKNEFKTSNSILLTVDL